MDLRKEVIKALDKVLASGKVEQAIEAKLEQTIKQVLDEELRAYSDFGQTITAAVKKSLSLNGELNLPEYNAAIIEIVRRQVKNYTEAAIQKQVAANLENLLEPPPAEIKLSELVTQFVQDTKERREGECVCYGDGETITLHVWDSDHGFWYVALDDDSDKKKENCDITIGVYKGKIFRLRFANTQIEKEMFAGPFYGFERMLFQMKAQNTILTRDDTDDVDLNYGEHRD